MNMFSARSALGLVLLCCSLVVGFGAYRLIHFWISPASSEGYRTIYYEVKLKKNPYDIAQELEKLGIVKSARLFYWAGRVSGKAARFKAGDYRFNTKMRPGEVMDIIISGVSVGHPVTIPEGYNIAQIAEILGSFRPGADQEFRRLCQDRAFIRGLSQSLGLAVTPESLEGYLFPDTYLVSRQSSIEELVRQMVRKYRTTFTTEMSARARELGFTEHQIVTLASIVEKETGADHERPLIASVFHNRLKKRMRLQSDPTVIYGIKDYKGNITRKHLETPTPYNTYAIRGLPPGPIANPGKDSLMAALYPAESNYLYFVSQNDGTHVFTSTYEEHHKAVVKFQLDRRQRQGKSWRDLRKNKAAASQ